MPAFAIEDLIFFADNHDVISVKFYELESTNKQEDDYSKVEPSASIFSPPRGKFQLLVSQVDIYFRIFVIVSFLMYCIEQTDDDVIFSINCNGRFLLQ